MAQISLSNYRKPTNKKWKAVSKFLTRTLPAYVAAIIMLPISDGAKVWITFASAIIVATISGLSELTAEGPNHGQV